jgi:UDP-N-acetylmuramoyl-L-alanyl-D-glutamate--2,6-diaminopimelate ligase
MTPLPRLSDCLDGFTTDPVPDLAVTGLTLDSRSVEHGMVFLAVQGSRKHGLDYLVEARARGAAAVVYEPVSGLQAPTGLPAMAVERLGHHAGEIAARFYEHPSTALWLAAVTGTNGKTSVAWFLAQVLEALGVPTGYLGTLGAGPVGRLEPHDRTTPDPVFLQATWARWRDQGLRAVALEASSHALDQGRLAGTDLDLGLFTNLTPEHLDYHRDLAGYRAAKARLFADFPLRAAVFNVGDATGREWARSPAGPERRLRVACDPEPGWEVDLAIRRGIRQSADGLSFELAERGRSVLVKTALWGRFHLENLLVVAGALRLRGLDLAEIAAQLGPLRAPPGRFERFEAPGRPLVIVDYAHTGDALLKALTSLRGYVSGPITVVFGCGGDRDPHKRPVMGHVAATYAQRIIVTDDNPRDESPDAIAREISSGVPHGHWLRIEHDRREAIRLALSVTDSTGAVLVAGKGHETVQVVGDRELPCSDRGNVSELLYGEGRP